jgi:hypothetical protein
VKKVLLLMMIALSSLFANDLKFNIGYSKMFFDKNQYLQNPSENYLVLGLEKKVQKEIFSYFPFFEIQAKLNSDRRVGLTGIGLEKDYNDYFVKASMGLLYMKWNHHPVSNYSAKNDSSNGLYGSFSIGKNLSNNFDVSLRYNRYNLDTRIKLGSTTIVAEDRNSISLLIGYSF